MNILIIKTGAIGDVLRTTCVLEGLIEKYFNPRIYWLTSLSSLAVIENNPLIRKLFVLEYLSPEIFSLPFDLVISLEEDKACLGLLAQLRYKQLFGVYAQHGTVTYTPRSSYWYNMSLISQFGKQTADALKKANLFSYPELLYRMLELPWNGQRPHLYLKDTTKKLSAAKLSHVDQSQKLVVGVVVGSGGRWPMKVLPPDRYVQLLQDLQKRFGKRIELLLLTGPSELELQSAGTITKELSFVKTHEVVNLETFFGIVNVCDVVITPDTLAMHIAISLKKYVIGYFTVTSAAEIEIYTGEKVITADAASYCSYTTANLPRPNCTDKVSLRQILEAVSKVLEH